MYSVSCRVVGRSPVVPAGMNGLVVLKKNGSMNTLFKISCRGKSDYSSACGCGVSKRNGLMLPHIVLMTRLRSLKSVETQTSFPAGSYTAGS